MGSACSTRQDAVDGQKLGEENKVEVKLTKPAEESEDLNLSPENFVKEKKDNIEDWYEVLSPPLGSGAFGEVRRARFRLTNEIRAVKIINKSSQSKEEQELLVNEVNILKGLDHPNIIKIYEFYQDARHFFIITELCTGGELFDKILQSKHLSEQQSSEIMIQILSAVSYCHQNRIVHRDLKPENLLIESRNNDARIKVIDFGLSRVFDPLRKMRHKLGTVYYIAPEVLKCSYDEKCDVWSCGVIAYILLCGFPPFNGKTDEEIVRNINSGKFSFHGEVWKHISDDAKNCISNMLIYDPTQRCTTQQALNHPWITKQEHKKIEHIHVANEAFMNLKGFRAGRKLAQATYIFLVTYLTTKDEKEELIKLFKALDQNNDGYISKEELEVGYAHFYGVKNAETLTNHIMSQIDTNHSGAIDYSEFVMAAMNKQLLVSKERLEVAFKAFDQDGNGYITAEELKQLLDSGSNISNQMWINLVKEVDQNNDGKISFKEFKDMMFSTIS